MMCKVEKLGSSKTREKQRNSSTRNKEDSLKKDNKKYNKMILRWNVQKLIPKGKVYFEIIFLFSFLAIVSGIMQQQQNERLNHENFMKGNIGKGMQKKEVALYVKDLNKSANVSIEIPEKTLSEEEIEQIFKEAKEKVEQQFLQKNKSLDEINSNIKLPETVLGGEVECTWNIQSNEILQADGSFWEDKIPKNGQILRAQVKLLCQEKACDYSFYFCVKPLKKSKMQKIVDTIKMNMKKEAIDRSYVRLPKEVDGHKLLWSYKKTDQESILLILGFLICALLYFREYEQNMQRKKQRVKELNYYYAEIISKICLFLGAGMTLRMIWGKVITTYIEQKQIEQIEPIEPYEQMVLTYQQMQEGMPEIEAYEQFAIRCKEAKYKKLVSLITQNIKKGQQEFIFLLEQEVNEAFVERKMYAKKRGEEASTKLLLPMLIMLFVVIAILMIPAVFAFQI